MASVERRGEAAVIPWVAPGRRGSRWITVALVASIGPATSVKLPTIAGRPACSTGEQAAATLGPMDPTGRSLERIARDDVPNRVRSSAPVIGLYAGAVSENS
jgi:hypothetical protein